jgi:trimethylamine monooxygenase
MQDQWYTFNMFDAQAWWVRDAILGTQTLPAKAAMQAESQAWREREETLDSDEAMIVFQGDYVKSLISETDYPSFDIDGVNRTFLEWEHHKHENIMTFRDHGYRSLMTGTQAPRHHTPWLEAMDDSLEAYLAQPAETEAEAPSDEESAAQATTTPMAS